MKETNAVLDGEMSGHIFFSVYKKLFKLTKISLENLNMLVSIRFPNFFYIASISAFFIDS